MFLVLLPRTKIDLQELYRIGKRSGSITNTKNEWIFLNAIRYLGFGMHEAAITSTKIYILLFYNE